MATANDWEDEPTHPWGEEDTVSLPKFRIIFMGAIDDGLRIHITPYGTHVIDMDCDGLCLVCLNPMEAS